MSLFFSSDLNKFKLGIQLKTLIYIINEKRAEIKDGIRIISSLNASQNLLVSVSNAPPILSVLDRVHGSTLCRVKTYLQSSMTQERQSSCLILATYEEKVDKLKLFKVANQFCFENDILRKFNDHIRIKFRITPN